MTLRPIQWRGGRPSTAAAVTGLLAIAAVVGFARTKFLAVRFRGASMEPTLFDGDLVIAARMARHMRRGGIVVFYEPHQVRPGAATPMPQSAPPSPTAAAAVVLVVKSQAAAS